MGGRAFSKAMCQPGLFSVPGGTVSWSDKALSNPLRTFRLFARGVPGYDPGARRQDSRSLRPGSKGGGFRTIAGETASFIRSLRLIPSSQDTVMKGYTAASSYRD